MKTFKVRVHWRGDCVKTTTLTTVLDHPEEDGLRVEAMKILGAAAVDDMGDSDRPLDEFTVEIS